MSKVKIMTDSVAGITLELINEFGIKVIPAANIFINGKSYTEGIDISVSEAYDQIQKDPDKFMTSPLTARQITDYYEELISENKQILFICISSMLTALGRVAQQAAEVVQEKHKDVKIVVWDSRTCSGAQALIVREAAKAASQGKSMDEIIKMAEDLRKKTGYVVYIDTLRYVYRTGRMSKLGARIASMFNVRPISKISDEGKLEYVTRAKSREDGIDKLLEIIADDKGKKPMHFWIMHADVPDFAATFCEQIKQKFTCLSMEISQYSAVMGYGTGRGAISAGYYPEV